MEVVEDKPKKHFIISFDGGGVRMTLQYTIMKRIIDYFPDLLDHVDIYAGTSAGALLAAYFATDNKLDIINEYNMGVIFKRSLWRKISSLGGLVKSKYSNKNLAEIVKNIFGEQKLSDVKKKLFIPVFRVTACEKTNPKRRRPSWSVNRIPRWRPVYRHNLDEELDCVIGDTKLSEILMETTAAPYYFPMHGNYVDGGIGNNNPSLSIVTALISRGVNIKDIYVLSIGSGETPNHISEGNKDWGGAQWLPNLLSMVFDASEEVTSQQCYDLLGDNFWRVQPVLESPIALDEPDKYQNLVDIGLNHDLVHTFEWLENLSAILY